MTTNHIERPHRISGPATTFGDALRSPARFLVIPMLIVAAAAHIPPTPEHLHEAPYIGALFIALTVACFALTLTLVVWDTPGVWALTAVVTGLAFLAYVVSRTVGLPQIGDDIGNWAEPLGVVSIVTEGVAFLVAGTVLLIGTTQRSDLR